jgi:hypothetical protein
MDDIWVNTGTQDFPNTKQGRYPRDRDIRFGCRVDRFVSGLFDNKVSTDKFARQ